MRITRIRHDPHWHYEVRLELDAGSAELQELAVMIRQLRAAAWPFLVGGSREAPQVALFVGPLDASQALVFERDWPEQLR
jgi:hypothetical protein